MERPHPSRRETNRVAKQQVIFKAAWELFTSQGFDATSIKQIAQQADVGDATVMLYAHDKASLLIRLFTDALKEHLQHTSNELFGTVSQQFGQHFHRFLSFYGQHPDLTRDFIRCSLLTSPNLSANDDWQALETWLASELLNPMQHILKLGLETRTLRSDLNIPLTSEMLYATFQVGLNRWLVGGFTFTEYQQWLQRMLDWQVTLLSEPTQT